MIIYKATNTINDKVYIGQTTQQLRTPALQHKRSNKNTKIRKAIEKYGYENFNWEIIDTATSIDELNEKEIMWIEKYNSIIEGYNLTTGGMNFRMSDETKLKMSGPKKDKSNYKGFKNPNNLPAWNKGIKGVIKDSDETKRKKSEALKGHKAAKGLIPWNKGLKGAQVAWNKGLKSDTPAWNKGIPCTDEMKNRISETTKGRIPWNKGIPCTEESKLKQIETKKKKKNDKN